MLPSDIPVRLKMMRRSQAWLAREVLDIDPSSLTKRIAGTLRFQPAEVLKIEKVFGEKLDLAVAATAPASPRRSAAAAKLPVYGYAAEDGEGVAYGEGAVVGRVEAPPFWDGEGEMIYVRPVDETMAPRYFAGELVPVKLNVTPAQGQDCMLELASGGVIIRTYRGERQGQVWVERYGDDPKIYGILATEVRRKHAVWRPGMI